MKDVKLPDFIYQKTADKQCNRVIIPKYCIDNWGIYYCMKVYVDEKRIELIPIPERKDI